MLCEELELPEGKLAEIVTALEDSARPNNTERASREPMLSCAARHKDHQASGHKGSPCYEE